MKRSINVVFEGVEKISIEPIGNVRVDDILRGLFALTDLLSENSDLNKVELAEQLVVHFKNEGEKDV